MPVSNFSDILTIFNCNYRTFSSKFIAFTCKSGHSLQMRNIFAKSLSISSCFRRHYRPWLVKIDYDGHGLKHWIVERASSVAVLCSLGAAVLFPCQPIDHALGVLLPIHCHIGFNSIITDYIPIYKHPFANNALIYLLYGLTGVTLYGLYQFNAHDIGLSRSLIDLYRKQS